MCSTRTTCVFPVRVTKTSPIRAASAIGTTLNPSICASSAFSGSISVTITFPPAPRARCANPRPHHPYPATTTVRPAINRLVARRMPSSVDCPVPYRLSNRCFVSESFTAITGNCSTPSRAIALRRMTPVVVSSVEPTTPVTSALRSAPERVSTQRRTGGARSSSRLRAIMCNAPTKSAPSSMVTSGRCGGGRRQPGSGLLRRRRRGEPSWSCVDFLRGVVLGALHREPQLLHAVRVLPGEQVDLPIDVLVDVAPTLGRAAEMAVGGGRAVDRLPQVQCLVDAAGGEVEHVANGVLDRFIGDHAGAE